MGGGGVGRLGKLSVPGRPNLDDCRARACCACSRCGWGDVWTFLFSSSDVSRPSVRPSVDTILSPHLLLQFSRDFDETFQLLFA